MLYLIIQVCRDLLRFSSNPNCNYIIINIQYRVKRVTYAKVINCECDVRKSQIKMESFRSTYQDVTKSDMHSRFIVQDQEVKLTSDMELLMYIITVVVVLQFLFKIYKHHRRILKKQLSRNMIV